MSMNTYFGLFNYQNDLIYEIGEEIDSPAKCPGIIERKNYQFIPFDLDTVSYLARHEKFKYGDYVYVPDRDQLGIIIDIEGDYYTVRFVESGITDSYRSNELEKQY